MNEIDFLYDHTAIALAELYSQWQETGKLNYDDGEREIAELWKESNNRESWDKHLDSLIELLQQE